MGAYLLIQFANGRVEECFTGHRWGSWVLGSWHGVLWNDYCLCLGEHFCPAQLIWVQTAAALEAKSCVRPCDCGSLVSVALALKDAFLRWEGSACAWSFQTYNFCSTAPLFSSKGKCLAHFHTPVQSHWSMLVFIFYLQSWPDREKPPWVSNTYSFLLDYLWCLQGASIKCAWNHWLEHHLSRSLVPSVDKRCRSGTLVCKGLVVDQGSWFVKAVSLIIYMNYES